MGFFIYSTLPLLHSTAIHAQITRGRKIPFPPQWPRSSRYVCHSSCIPPASAVCKGCNELRNIGSGCVVHVEIVRYQSTTKRGSFSSGHIKSIRPNILFHYHSPIFPFPVFVRLFVRLCGSSSSSCAVLENPLRYDIQVGMNNLTRGTSQVYRRQQAIPSHRKTRWLLGWSTQHW